MFHSFWSKNIPWLNINIIFSEKCKKKVSQVLKDELHLNRIDFNFESLDIVLELGNIFSFIAETFNIEKLTSVSLSFQMLCFHEFA